MQRPLVDGQDGLPGLRLGLRAQLHALGEDDLLLRGEERHAADLAQVEAHGVVGVEDLGRDGLRLRFGLRLGDRGGGLLDDRLLDREGGLGLQLRGHGIELDGGSGELGLRIGGGGRRIEGNHDAPAETNRTRPRGSWIDEPLARPAGRALRRVHATRHT